MTDELKETLRIGLTRLGLSPAPEAVDKLAAFLREYRR